MEVLSEDRESIVTYPQNLVTDFDNRVTVFPSYQTLRETLGNIDMKVFRHRWEKYVLGLVQGYEVTVRP